MSEAAISKQINYYLEGYLTGEQATRLWEVLWDRPEYLSMLLMEQDL